LAERPSPCTIPDAGAGGALAAALPVLACAPWLQDAGAIECACRNPSGKMQEADTFKSEWFFAKGAKKKAEGRKKKEECKRRKAKGAMQKAQCKSRKAKGIRRQTPSAMPFS
jgi:hypothetical protein